MKRSKIIYDVPPDVRRLLDVRIVESGFASYALHQGWLAEHGYTISESSLQRYGAQLRQLERVRLATREATALIDTTDDTGQLADATVRLAQVRLYELLQAIDDGDLRAVSAGARAIADLARASQSLREERRRTIVESAAAATSAARANGVSLDVEAAIRRAVEGLE